MKIGIYLGYPPRVRLSSQGLGRYLQHLVKGFANNPAASLVILTPSWLRDDIAEFLTDQDIPLDRITFLAPRRLPMAIRLFDLFERWKNRPGRLAGVLQKLRSALNALNAGARSFVFAYVSRVLTSRSVAAFAIRLLPMLALAPVLIAAGVALMLPLAMLKLALAMARGLWSSRALTWTRLKARPFLALFTDLVPASRDPLIGALFEQISREESRLMIALANREACDVWYSPTAFWPEVTRIKGKLVICVPDLSPSDFPVHYAIKFPHVAATVEKIVTTIRSGVRFITYGDRVAKQTLVRQLGVPAENVFTIAHAPNRLDHHIRVSGTPDPAHAMRRFATSLIEAHRAVHFQQDDYRRSYAFSDTKYIFYPTQIRPNKNILNLLLAYEILLRKKYRHVKLFLTGAVREDRELRDFIHARRLGYEIFDFQDVSDQLLAALYHRAELVVNTSLFEGGFPFTFSEGLSVGTPSVQADLPEARSFLGDDLGDRMLFDPYDPEHIAEVIAWGLDNRQTLLGEQMKMLDRFENNSWDRVADRHIEIFHQICKQPDSA